MSQRKSQTCVDCARRKIKCDKEIPCANCRKRGTSQSCRRSDVGRPVAAALSTDPDFNPINVPDAESRKTSDTTISLLRILVDRVERLEASLHNAQKRPALDTTQVSSIDGIRKRIKIARGPAPPISPNPEPAVGDDESYSVHDDSQAEVEEAATVLEFLAWGRLKDANFADTLKPPVAAQEPKPFVERETPYSIETWGLSSSSVSGVDFFPVGNLQLSRIQEILPSHIQVLQLFNFHKEWLLFLHCSWYASSVTQELENFYSHDRGSIGFSSTQLQWSALLFAILSSTAACAKPEHMSQWGFRQEEHSFLAKQWYQASIECMNAARYQQSHNLYSVQAISTMTICAHILGFSNTQSVLIASALRIAQSLGLHRLKGEKVEEKAPTSDQEREARIQLETGRRVWQQLVTQDWFSVPFSETYAINPLHFTSKQPLNLDEESMDVLPRSSPSTISYGNFCFDIATLMPKLQEKTLQTQTVHSKYEQVLHFDRKMRDLVTSKIPPCLKSQVPIDPSWPNWIALARPSLTITSAHKIIMIHRRFLGISLTDNRFEFTRRTCLAAAKTIINELKQEGPIGSPNLWHYQAFCIAAAIILTLDNFYRNPSTSEYIEHRNLVSEAMTFLSSISVSALAPRGIRLLTALLGEEQKFRARDVEKHSERGYRAAKQDGDPLTLEKNPKSLDVSAFVKKFCETDPQVSYASPTVSQIPLWLNDSSASTHPEYQQRPEDMHSNCSTRVNSYSSHTSRLPPTAARGPLGNTQHPLSLPGQIHQDAFMNPFGQNYTENFDMQGVNWFNSLLGLAPSDSI